MAGATGLTGTDGINYSIGRCKGRTQWRGGPFVGMPHRCGMNGTALRTAEIGSPGRLLTMKHISIIFALCGLLLLAGCETVPWKKQEPLPPVELLDDTAAPQGAAVAPPPDTSGLTLSANQRFKEVPLPEKAKEDLDRSYIYESSTLQIGRMVYNIRADINSLAQFYINESPAAGWKLESLQQATGNAYLLFRKPGKRLEVTIQPLGIGRGQRLILHMVPDGGGM